MGIISKIETMRTLNFSINSGSEELDDFNIQIDETADSFSVYMFKLNCNAKMLIIDLPKQLDDGSKVTAKDIMEEIETKLSDKEELERLFTDFEVLNSDNLSIDGFSDDFDTSGFNFDDVDFDELLED